MVARVRFVSFSPCGGTEKVAAALGRDIALPKLFHSITLPKNRADILAFSGSDLVFLAFPVYGGRMPLYFPSIVSCLLGDDSPLVMVAVYGNRAYEGAFLDMHGTVLANGFKPIAAIAAVAEHSGSPMVATGRPDVDDTEKLSGFGVRVLRRAREGAQMVKIPGAYPEWRIPPNTDLSLHTDPDVCTACGLCADVCPNAAIPVEAPQTTVIDKCIACSACIKYCPQKARRLGDAQTKKVFSSHLLHAVERKEPELFF